MARKKGSCQLCGRWVRYSRSRNNCPDCRQNWCKAWECQEEFERHMSICGNPIVHRIAPIHATAIREAS